MVAEAKLKDIKKLGKIDRFLIRYSSKSTQRIYRNALNLFFKVIETNPDTYFDEKNHDYKSDVEAFAYAISDYAPKTFISYLSGLKQFFRHNDIELKSYFWHGLKNTCKYKRMAALTEDRIPTNEELKAILAHCSFRTRTFILMAISSGCRIGELAAITIDDVDLDYTPTKITLRPEITKTGVGRVTFISDEATKALKEWLTKRKEYMIYQQTRVLPGGRRPAIPEPNLVFPMTGQSLRCALTRALEKVNLADKDKQTNRMLIHPHSFRKYFKTRLSVTCPVPVVEKLMGHEGYLSGAYDRFTVEELAKLYKASMNRVSVWDDGASGERIRKLEKQIQDQESLIDQLTEKQERYGFTGNNLRKMIQEEIRRVQKPPSKPTPRHPTPRVRP